MDGFAIVPPGQDADGYVELSRSAKGRVFRKQILEYGDLIYPGVQGGKVHIDDEFADKLIANFSNKVCDIVQVPKAGANNEHTEDPDRNIGEVIGLTKKNGKIYADIDVRTDDADKLGKTLLGASAMMHLNYRHTKTGKPAGPTLLHVAVTNRPYVTELEDFEEILAASADGIRGDAVLLTADTSTNTKGKKMATLDELFAELKADHNIDVPALQEKAAGVDAALKLSNEIQEKLTDNGLLKLSNGETATADELVGAVAEAGTKLVELSNRIDSMEEDSRKKDAESRIDSLVRSGHILPAKRDAHLKILLSNPEDFDALIPEKPLVKLSVNDEEETGFEVAGGDEVKLTAQSEIDRIAALPEAKQYIRS